MEKIIAYKTKDGKIFERIYKAEQYELNVNINKNLEAWVAHSFCSYDNSRDNILEIMLADKKRLLDILQGEEYYE